VEIGVRFSVGSFVSANPTDLVVLAIVSENSKVLGVDKTILVW
jgi:hypothetical protein